MGLIRHVTLLEGSHLLKPCAHRVAAAKGVADLPPEVYVALLSAGGMIEATYTDSKGKDLLEGSSKVWGSITAKSPDAYDGPCLGAFILHSVRTARGYGPMLYDVAMEEAGNKGLTADRGFVKDRAEAVWAFYMRNRPDVRWKQLDIYRELLRGANKGIPNLTPTPDDDCDMDHRAYKTLERMLESPLTKVYYASGKPTIQALKKAGRLIRV